MRNRQNTAHVHTVSKPPPAERTVCQVAINHDSRGARLGLMPQGCGVGLRRDSDGLGIR